MRLFEVNDKKSAKEFLVVARIIYRDDPVWVCPLDSDISKIFDPVQNTYFRDGEAIRWILKDDRGYLIGRVAAFYNRKKAERYGQPTGSMGFFECTNNHTAAFILFDACREWLRSKDMEAMDGPVNFGENDNFWGLLVEGFTRPAYGMNYHRPYYKDLFEAYGFVPFFTQVTKHLDLTVPFPERFWKIAEWAMKRPGYSFRHFDYKESEKFIHDLKEVHDQAWVFHEHFTPLDEQLVRRALIDAKPILVPEFIWFVYHNEKPVAFFVMFPDLNMILRHFNGKLHLWNKIRFLYYKWRKEMTRNRITILGVIPKYQGQGVESAIFWHLQEPVLVKRPYIKEFEISWVGDYNPKMQAVLEAMGANPGKKHITYRKLFKEITGSQYASTIPVDTKYRKEE